jgi:hypothetical protein
MAKPAASRTRPPQGRRSLAKRIGAASLSLTAFTVVALTAVGMTTPASALNTTDTGGQPTTGVVASDGDVAAQSMTVESGAEPTDFVRGNYSVAVVAPVVVISHNATSLATFSVHNTSGSHAWGGFADGEIPLSALVPIPWDPSHGDGGKGSYLRADAEAALAQLDTAFKAHFGVDFGINDAYRDLAAQAQALGCHAQGECGVAGALGTSIHGWALAVDISYSTTSRTALQYGSAEYIWLAQNGPAYGWGHPSAGYASGEAWHFEYLG